MSWLPCVVTLNCIDDFAMKQDRLSGVAAVENVPLSHLADCRIDSASAVVLQSLAYLPRAAQRRPRPYQLILCLGSGDYANDSTFTADLGCQSLKHFDGRISGVYIYESSEQSLIEMIARICILALVYCSSYCDLLVIAICEDIDHVWRELQLVLVLA